MDYIKNDNRTIKIEPNPFKKPRVKIKMKVKRMSGGQPITNQSGQTLYKEEEPKNLTRIPGTSKTITPARTRSGLIRTGLTHFAPNPYIDEPVYKTEWAERLFKGKDRAKLQHLLEYELGYDFDYLTDNIPHRTEASNKDDKKFFEKPESRITLTDNAYFLHLSNPLDRILYHMLKADPEIANSFAELEDGVNKKANWYFADEQEKDEYKLTKIDKEIKAAAALADLKKVDDAIQQMAKSLDIEEANDRNLTKERSSLILYKYYNENADNWKRFIEFYEMWQDPTRRNYVIVAAELFDYVKIGVISYRNGKYTWTRRGEEGKPSENFVRANKNDMINNFLLDPAYQEEVELIQEEFEAKLK